MEKLLETEAVIGYKGDVIDGLILHPDNEHILFPLGSTVIVRHIISRTQTFLKGHDNEITAMACSRSGKYVASGQKTYQGLKADIIIWNFADRSILQRLSMHKVCINSLAFSPNDKFLGSVGGLDDKNTLIIWDLEQNGKPSYGSSLGNKEVSMIKFYNQSDFKLCASTTNTVQILTIDPKDKKIRLVESNLGNIKRAFNCVSIDSSDEFVYAGTKTGDILEIDLDKAIFKRVAPSYNLFSMGVRVIYNMPNKDLLIGAGDGTLAKISIQNMMIKTATLILGSISSIAMTADATHFFCGTALSNIYWVDASSLAPELRNTCHSTKINDVVFPHGYSDVFATCSMNDIRIWNAKNRHEILRIQVPTVECHCIAFMRDGKSIVSGWSDGKIRAFFPQSGKLMYVINDAHVHGVTAILGSSDCNKIVSGGMEGEVRIWRIGRQSQSMEASMKEHRNRVWSIKLRGNNEQALSCSSDGSCIIWDMKTHTRVMCFFESTLFKEVVFHPDESQILTTGADRKISYWGTFDGQVIRSIEGSQDSEINCLSISKEGEVFVSAGNDRQVKLWGYDDGHCYRIGLGHAGPVNKVAIAPDQKTIVSVGSEGAIFVWRLPQDVLLKCKQTSFAMNEH